MAFRATDARLLLRDFGVQCTVGAVSFKGLLDEPDELISLQRADVLSRQYQLTFEGSVTAIQRGVSVVVDGRSFRVIEAPRQLSDGAFATARLTQE